MLSGCRETISKGFKNGIEPQGDDGRHVERLAKARVAGLTKPGTAMNGCPGATMSRRKSSKRCDGLGRFEVIQMRDLGQQRSSGGFADSRNRRQEIALALEVRMIAEVLPDLPFNLRNLLVNRGDHLANRSFYDRRLRRLLVDRLLDTGYLEVLVMTHKSL